MFRRSRTIESNLGRAPPMRPVPPPHGTSFNPASTTKRTTVTTSSTDCGKTTAAGDGPCSSKREPRCARNASVWYRGGIEDPVKTRLGPRRSTSCDTSALTGTRRSRSYSKRTPLQTVLRRRRVGSWWDRVEPTLWSSRPGACEAQFDQVFVAFNLVALRFLKDVLLHANHWRAVRPGARRRFLKPSPVGRGLARGR